MDVAITFLLWGVPVAIPGLAGECGDLVALRRVNPCFSPSQAALCRCLLVLQHSPGPTLLTPFPTYGDTSPVPLPFHGGDTEAETIMFRGCLVTEVGFQPMGTQGT